MCIVQTFFSERKSKQSSQLTSEKAELRFHAIERKSIKRYAKTQNMLPSAAQEKNRKQLCLIRVPKSFILSHRAVL
jgi:hypothetical protein